MKRGKKAICAMLLLLLLPGCAIPRVLTELPEGEIVEYVRLRDGYLRFVNGLYIGNGMFSLAARVIELPYEDIVADLGFDPVEMTQMLPEKYHMTEECLEEVYEGTNPPYKMPLGGYRFSLKGEPWEFGKFGKISHYPEFRVIFKRLTEEEKNRTVRYFPLGTVFSNGTLPWEGYYSVDQEKRALWRSEIGEHEIGIIHKNHGSSFAPGWRWDFFYAGFYMGDLAVSIESSYDYCTEAEFVEVFLAIFDYVRELEY